jgi:hypothetical protein
MYILNCNLDPARVGSRVRRELLVNHHHGRCSGLSVEAAAVHHDVAVRISCSSHAEAGRLLASLQASCQCLTLDEDVDTGEWGRVVQYQVRSEFLASEDELIYRILCTMQKIAEQRREGPAAARDSSRLEETVNFGQLCDLYSTSYGDGDRLQLEDVRRLCQFVVLGSMEEVARIGINRDSRRSDILRWAALSHYVRGRGVWPRNIQMPIFLRRILVFRPLIFITDATADTTALVWYEYIATIIVADPDH